MLKRKTGLRNLGTKGRIAFGCIGFVILVTGISTLARGRLHYPNYWGGAVFAPFAVIVGALTIIVMIAKRR